MEQQSEGLTTCGTDVAAIRGVRARSARRDRWSVTILSSKTCASLRRSLVLLAILPLTAVLGFRIAHLVDDPLLGAYAALAVGITSLVMYLAFAHYHDRSEDTPLPADAPLVTCLVAVKDEAAMIERCIRSLLASTYPNLELVVVDDGSTDGTAAVLAQLCAELDFTLISLPSSVGKKRALTKAAGRADGELLVFTDSDCVVADDAVERVVRAFEADPQIGAVSGHARALNGDVNALTRAQDAWYEGQFRIWKGAESTFGAVSCISGPLAAFRREAIYAFFPAWADDRFLGKEFRFATDRQLTGYVLASNSVRTRVLRPYADSPFVRAVQEPTRQWRAEYVRSARVWTVVPPTLRRFLTQQIRWKKSFIRNLCFTGRFYWRRGPVPAALFYAHVLFVLGAPVMAFRHLVQLPLNGDFMLASLYVGGVLVKGVVWAVAYRVDPPRDGRWLYRPLMSVMTVIVSAGLLLYAALSLRRSAWVRG